MSLKYEPSSEPLHISHRHARCCVRHGLYAKDSNNNSKMSQIEGFIDHLGRGPLRRAEQGRGFPHGSAIGQSLLSQVNHPKFARNVD